MNRTTISTIASVLPVAMLCIGIGIIMVPPIVFEGLSSYSPENETLVENAINSSLMGSTLPIISTALLILGLIGLGIPGLLKKYQYVNNGR